MADQPEGLGQSGPTPDPPAVQAGGNDVGIVYVLENAAMPGYVKIGMTDNLDQRMRQLSSSSAVPVPFSCYYAARVQNPASVERALHEVFGDKRVHRRREFFGIDDPRRVATALKMVQIEEATPVSGSDGSIEQEDIEAEQRVVIRAERKENFNFAMVGVPIGEELRFVEDEKIVCKVAQQFPARVEFDGAIMSLSAAAGKVKQSSWTPQGTRYWKYGDETLQERRERIESLSDGVDG